MYKFLVLFSVLAAANAGLVGWHQPILTKELPLIKTPHIAPIVTKTIVTPAVLPLVKKTAPIVELQTPVVSKGIEIINTPIVTKNLGEPWLGKGLDIINPVGLDIGLKGW